MTKPITLLLAAILIGIIVLSVAVRGQLAEKHRLEEDFASLHNRLAQTGAGELARQWEALEEDGRLVAALASQVGAPRQGSATDKTRMLESLRALAIVVRYYRSITFVPWDGSPAISATDPVEKPDAAAWLLEQSLNAARHVAGQGERRTEGPFRSADGRDAFFHATAVDGLGAVVLGVDAKLLFQRVPRMTSQARRYAILDHAGGLWLGCHTAATCVRQAESEWQTSPALVELTRLTRQADHGSARVGDGLSKLLGLADGTALLAWHPFKAGDATWSFAAVASPDALLVRESALVWRLVLTSLALAFSLGAISFIGIRIQRRQAELKEHIRLMQQQAHVREQTETIINNIPTGILGIASDGRVVRANRFVHERLAPVTVGLPVEQAFPAGSQQGAQKLRELVDEAIRGRQQLIMRRPDVDLLSARPEHFEVRVAPIGDPTGETAAIVVIEDLGELRGLERQLLRAEKLATVGVLTAGLAHEIGTPLGIIRVRTETLLEHVSPSEARDLGSILGQIDRITTIIRQLLDFSREQPVDPRPTDVGAAAKTAGDLLGWRLQQKSLALRILAEQGPLSLAADPDQLQQVLVNLLMNACDACAEGGHITIRSAREKGTNSLIRLEVEDDGCGIPPEHLHAVFDPFFTTKKRGEGTGLGLTVVASIVRNHGGHVSITSAPKRKTTVVMVWPAANEEVKLS